MELVQQFRLSKLVNNTFLIKKEGKYILIDAPDDIYKVIEFLRTNNINLDEVWLTHCHFDHILGLKDLKEEFPNLRVFSSKDEINMITNSNDNLLVRYNMFFDYPYEIEDNQKLLEEYNDLEIKIISGHSYASSVYILKNSKVMFTGDVLFRETVGRSDLIYGDFNKLNTSIKKELFIYEGDYIVYPGHGLKTSIEHEKKHNKLII